VSIAVLADYPHQHAHDSNGPLLWTGLDRIGFLFRLFRPPFRRLAAKQCLQRDGWPHRTTSDDVPLSLQRAPTPSVQRRHGACFEVPVRSADAKENARIVRAPAVSLPGRDLHIVLRPPVAMQVGNLYWRRRIWAPFRVSWLS
jgi:hypothetical protein